MELQLLVTILVLPLPTTSSETLGALAGVTKATSLSEPLVEKESAVSTNLLLTLTLKTGPNERNNSNI